MTFPAAPENQSGMVRGLIIAIVVMTLAIVLLFGAIIGRLMSPNVAPADALDFIDAETMEVALPAGANVLDIAVSAERATIVIETEAGGREILTTPLSGFDRPVRLQLGERP